MPAEEPGRRGVTGLVAEGRAVQHGADGQLAHPGAGRVRRIVSILPGLRVAMPPAELA